MRFIIPRIIKIGYPHAVKSNFWRKLLIQYDFTLINKKNLILHIFLQFILYNLQYNHFIQICFANITQIYINKYINNKKNYIIIFIIKIIITSVIIKN